LIGCSSPPAQRADRRLVLNDVGAFIPWGALIRMKGLDHAGPRFSPIWRVRRRTESDVEPWPRPGELGCAVALITPLLAGLSRECSLASVAIAKPGAVYADRLHQIDVRISKTFDRVENARPARADLYNLFNAIPSWRDQAYTHLRRPRGSPPQAILPGRIVKFGVLIDF